MTDQTRGERFLWTAVGELALTPAETVAVQLVANAIDEVDRLDRQIAEEGASVQDRFDQAKPNPLVEIRDRARAFIVDTLGKLRLGREGGPPLRDDEVDETEEEAADYAIR